VRVDRAVCTMDNVTVVEDYVPADGSKPDVPMQALNADGTPAEQRERGESSLNHQRDPNQVETKVPEMKKASCQDILSNPCNYMFIWIFTLAGVIGAVFAIICFGKNAGQSEAMYASIVLLALGAIATYQIRNLAALKKELNELVEVGENLKEQVGRLDEEVAKYDQHNEDFRLQTKELEEANEKFKGEVQELQETQQDLAQTKEEFEAKNAELNEQVEKLGQANESMTNNLNRMSEHADQLEGEIQQFTALQQQIQKYAQEQGMEMGQALEKQNEMFDKLQMVMNDNAATLLQQIATDMEFVDDDEGMTEEEYNKWYERIPQRFKDELANRGISFQTFAGDDNVMQYEEMTELIDSLLKDAQAP